MKGLGRVNDAEVRAGDGVAAGEPAGLTITAEVDIEALVFDLA